MHISLCSGLIFRRNCRKREGQRISRAKPYCLHKGHSLHTCMCVCPCACKHLCLHFWHQHCAGICNRHVWYGCCVNRVCYIWPPVIPTQIHPPMIHTHFTLVFTRISPCTHVHPLSALQVSRPTDGDHLPLLTHSSWHGTTCDCKPFSFVVFHSSL